MPIEIKKSDFDAPPHDVLRIDVTGFQVWDCMSTKLYVRAVCEDVDGRESHTLVSTKTTYLDLRLPDAICKDAQWLLGIATTEKLVNKPRRGVRLVIHDYLAFLYLTRQTPPTTRTMRLEWIGKAWRAARRCAVPVTIELGSPALKAEFRAFVEAVEDRSAIVPTPETTGDALRRFVRFASSARSV